MDEKHCVALIPRLHFDCVAKSRDTSIKAHRALPKKTLLACTHSQSMPATHARAKVGDHLISCETFRMMRLILQTHSRHLFSVHCVKEV